MFCSQCGASISELDEYCRICGFQQARVPEKYYPVSVTKFVLLNVATFNLYLFYWFYMNWFWIRGRDQSNIRPIWRTIFMVLWCYPFLRDLDGEARQERGDPQPGTIKIASNAVLAILFFLLVSVSWRLPDPYWLVSMLGFMPLLPAVTEIKRLNGQGSYHFRRNSKLVLRHYALMILIFPLVALVIAQSIGLIPSPYVIAGTELSERQTRMIRELAALGDDERIDFYYADGFLSYEEDGNVVTDQRVVSYFRDEAGIDNLASAPYEEISSLHVHFGTFFEPTLILVCLGNKESFLLYAGTEEKKDRRFVYAIKNRLRHGAPYIVEEHEDFTCESQTGA